MKHQTESPDSPGGVNPAPPEEVLRKVLATSGADLSATQTRAAELAAALSPVRLEAEGAAIQNHRRQQRYAQFLVQAGVAPNEIDAAKAAGRWPPLLG